MKKIIRSNRGAALAIVLVIFTVVAILGTIVLTIALSQNSLSVASEDTTAAYYYARSAVDIISTNIKEKQETLAAAQQAYHDDPLNPAKADAYTAAEAAVAKLVPPNVSETRTVQLSNIISGSPVTVTIARDASNTIKLSSSVNYENGSSSAQAKIGSFSAVPGTITYTTYVNQSFPWLGDDAIYAWGNVTLDNNKNNFDLVPANAPISAGGTVAAPEQITNISNGMKHDMLIVTPPAGLSIKNTQETNDLGNKTSLSALDNGIYKAMSEKQLNWSVNTDDGDVILVFPTLKMGSSTIINVTGKGNLYIYLQETYTAGTIVPARTLMELGQQVHITVNGHDASAANPPKTYFIAYNDSLQKYSENNGGSTLIPAATRQTEIDTISSSVNMDKVIMGNLNFLSAYFYLPGCYLEHTNQSNYYGAIYASGVYMKNQKNYNYIAFDDKGLLEHVGTPVGEQLPVQHSIEYTVYTSIYDRQWLR